jgi:hypothetical protein
MLRRSLASSEAWAQDVAAQPFAAILVVGGHAGSSLQVECVGLPAQSTLGDRLLVRVEHDADGLALPRRTGRLYASGGGSEQLGEQGIVLPMVSSATTVTSPSPGAATRVITPRR